MDIYKILILELFIIINASFDAWKIKKDWKIRHGIEGFVQGLVISCVSLYGKIEFDAWWPLISTHGWLIFAFGLCLFWLQFDYLLNWIRTLIGESRKKWWHLGSAFMDQILKGYVLRYWRLGLKIVLVVVSGALVLIY